MPIVIDFSKNSAANHLKSILISLEMEISSAESSFQNICTDAPVLTVSLNSNQDGKRLLEDIIQHAKDKDIINKSNTSSYERGIILFADGKFKYMLDFFRYILKTYFYLFTQSNYEYQDTLNLFNDIVNFEKHKAKITHNFHSCYDDFLKFLIESDIKYVNDSQCRILTQTEVNDNVKDVNECLTEIDEFLKELKIVLIRACAFCLDEKKRSLLAGGEPLIHEEEYARIDTIFDGYNIKAELEKVDKAFINFSNGMKHIDNLDPKVKRLKYICQSLDKAIFFNPGFCEGGIRDWADLIDVKEVIENTEIHQFRTYRDLNDYSISHNAYRYQSNQLMVHQNQTGKQIVYRSALYPEAPNPNHTTLGFVSLLQKTLQNWAEAHLALNHDYILINVHLCEAESAHAIGIKVYKNNAIIEAILKDKSNDLIYLIRDLNFGEFLMHSNQFCNWFNLYIQAIPPYHKFNQFRISTFYKTPVAFQLLKEMYDSAYSKGHLDLIPAAHKPFISTGYYLYLDKKHKNEMARSLKMVYANPEEQLMYLEKIIISYKKIYEPRTIDHEAAVYAYLLLGANLEDIDLQKAKAHSLKGLSLSLKLKLSDPKTHTGTVATFQLFLIHVESRLDNGDLPSCLKLALSSLKDFILLKEDYISTEEKEHHESIETFFENLNKNLILLESYLKENIAIPTLTKVVKNILDSYQSLPISCLSRNFTANLQTIAHSVVDNHEHSKRSQIAP